MITYLLTTDVLGNTRFSFSPLAEATLSLRLLGCPHPTNIHAPWLRQVRNRLAGVDLELLLAVAPSGKWVADCLMPVSTGPQVTIEEQLHEVAQTAADDMGRDLLEVWQDEPAVPRRVRELVRSGSGAPHQLAEVLWDYWDAALEPFWNRICAVLEDDVFHRVAAQMNSGLFALLEDLHPEVSLEGDLLHVDKPHHASATYYGREMDLDDPLIGLPKVVCRSGPQITAIACGDERLSPPGAHPRIANFAF